MEGEWHQGKRPEILGTALRIHDIKVVVVVPTLSTLPLYAALHLRETLGISGLTGSSSVNYHAE